MKKVIILMFLMVITMFGQTFKQTKFEDEQVVKMQDDSKVASVLFTEAEEQVVIQSKGMWTAFDEFELP
jgi:hypothetical protein